MDTSGDQLKAMPGPLQTMEIPLLKGLSMVDYSQITSPAVRRAGGVIQEGLFLGRLGGVMLSV